MTIEISGQLEIDQHRGVIYFHSNEGRTILRICRLNFRLPADAEFNPRVDFLDITHMVGASITQGHIP